MSASSRPASSARNVAILLVTISLHDQHGGGTAGRTRQLATHLAALGRRCEVVTMEGGVHADALRAAGIPVQVTGYVRPKFHVPLINPFGLYRLVRRADSIHILGYWNLLSVAVGWMARAVGRPYALSAAGEFATLAQPRRAARWFHRLFGIGMIRHARSLIAITPLERDEVAERFGREAPPIVIIPNGVAIPPAMVPPTAERKTVLFLGRLAPIKGPDLLLEAFHSITHRHPDLELVLAGPDFGLRDQLAARIAQLGLGGRVRLAGFVDERERAALFGQALVVCVPSRNEAMSLVALEAGAAGLPVLLTDRCGFDEVATIGGGAVTPATVPGLAAGLERLLADREGLAAMGQRLHDHVCARYAWPRIAVLLQDHLAGLNSTPQRGPR